MVNMDERESLMQRDVLLVAIAGLSLLNGMSSSPVLFPIYFLLRPFLAGTFLEGDLVMTYIASFMASAITVLIAGVPAAIYERVAGLKDSNTTSLLIWLAATLVLVGGPFLLGGKAS